MKQLYCPLCNWEIYNNKCTNTRSYCRYTGNGVPREPIQPGELLGDITGDPINNGDVSNSWYSEDL